jgi:hypothetical protein
MNLWGVSALLVIDGFESRSVAVMACDNEVLPPQGRIENVADDADPGEAYDTERRLLYVACTGITSWSLASVTLAKWQWTLSGLISSYDPASHEPAMRPKVSRPTPRHLANGETRRP